MDIPRAGLAGVALAAAMVGVGALVFARADGEPESARLATLPEHRQRSPLAGSTAIACSPEEPGERVLMDIRVSDQFGNAVPGAVVVAYNADRAGLYTARDAPTRTPRIRATVTSDERGRCQVLTVRPGPYPEGTEPAHVHFESWTMQAKVSYRTIWFEGDPMITKERRAWAEGDAETEIVKLASTGHSIPVCQVAITLRLDE